jgi:hypothetical protein
MKNILVILLIGTVAIWWAVKNPYSAQKVISELEAAIATVANAVTD